MSIEHLV